MRPKASCSRLNLCHQRRIQFPGLEVAGVDLIWQVPITWINPLSIIYGLHRTSDHWPIMFGLSSYIGREESSIDCKVIWWAWSMVWIWVSLIQLSLVHSLDNRIPRSSDGMFIFPGLNNQRTLGTYYLRKHYHSRSFDLDTRFYWNCKPKLDSYGHHRTSHPNLPHNPKNRPHNGSVGLMGYEYD